MVDFPHCTIIWYISLWISTAVRLTHLHLPPSPAHLSPKIFVSGISQRLSLCKIPSGWRITYTIKKLPLASLFVLIFKEYLLFWNGYLPKLIKCQIIDDGKKSRRMRWVLTVACMTGLKISKTLGWTTASDWYRAGQAIYFKNKIKTY